MNAETDTNSKFPSDHYPLIAEVKLKLQKYEPEDAKSSGTKWKAVQKPHHKMEVVKKNEQQRNRHPSYPTQLNLSLEKFSDDFYDNFAELIQTTDQLFPTTREKLDEQVSLINKALVAAAEENLKPREKIERTFFYDQQNQRNKLIRGTN